MIAAANGELSPEQKTLETPRVQANLKPATVRKVRAVSTLVPVATVVSSGTVIPATTIVSSGRLRIEIEHDFTEAHASVWVDNSLVYEHLLHGDSKRRGLIFRKVEGYQLDAVNVPTGKHNVRVRIHSSNDSFDETTTMADATIGTNDSILRVVCGKKSGRLELRLD